MQIKYLRFRVPGSVFSFLGGGGGGGGDGEMVAPQNKNLKIGLAEGEVIERPLKKLHRKQ